MTDGSARITAGELVVVLSHYDVGVIDAVRRFKGGSRRSPKVLVDTRGGSYLLKRRTAATDVQSDRVTQAHALHAALRAADFPVAELMRSRAGETAVRLGGPGPAHGVYELYRFVSGERYARLEPQAREAGRLLGQLHVIGGVAGIDAGEGTGGFHARGEMREAINEASRRLGGRAEAACAELAALYRRASDEAERLGVREGPTGTLHGDWHPGNMLFGRGTAERSRVAAVLDLDSVRMGPLVMDVANGALQFAVLRRTSAMDETDGMDGEDGAADAGASGAGEAGGSGSAVGMDRPWRISLSGELLGAFCGGYRSGGRPELPAGSWAALPWLMCEALIVEAVVPIAQAGTFGGMDPARLLGVVARTAGLIVGQAGRVAGAAGGI